MTEMVITDLTRFNNEKIVCTAGVDTSSGACIRPMPYIKTEMCRLLRILPGAILKGTFTPAANRSGPHQEDMNYAQLSFVGASTSDVFRQALERGMFDNVEAGFQIRLSDKQKHIPINHKIDRSIVTIRVDSRGIHVVEDPNNKGRLKLTFTDQSGKAFSYLPITDLGFHRYAVRKFNELSLDELNKFIHKQQETYLRIGLSRAWENQKTSTNGYWMQVNGLYTFPSFLEELRSYK